LLNCSAETESSNALIELLVFLEFDFYNSNGNPRILEKDNILVFKCPHMWGSEYRIIGFSTDLSTLSQVDICNLVSFNTTPQPSATSAGQAVPPTRNEPILFEWDKMKSGLKERKKIMARNNQDSGQLRKCQDLIDSITEYLSQDELRHRYEEAQKIGYTYEG